MNKFFKNPANIYTLLYCFYYLQGVFFVEGGIISKTMLLAILSISFFNLYQVNSSYPEKPSYFKGLNLFFAFFFVYYIIRLVSGEDYVYMGEIQKRYLCIKNICLSFFPIYSYYYYAKKSYIDDVWIRRWVIVFFLTAIVSFVLYQEKALLSASLIGSSRTEFTNNTGYLFVSLIPALYFFRHKPILMYSLLFCAEVFIIIAMKRGAILVSAICLLLFFFHQLSKSSNKQKLLLLLFGAIFLFAMWNFISDEMASSSYFNERIEQTKDGDASFRNEMYPIMINFYINQPRVFGMLFGNGIDSPFELFGWPPHHDWLYLLVCMGLLGVILYINYWKCFLKTWKGMSNIIDYSRPLLMIMIIYFTASFFSTSFDSMPYYATCILGYCLSKNNKIYEAD